MNDLKAAWGLDPEVTHLNHGSFGAAPTAVLEAQAEWRRELERNPVRFMLERYQPALEVARERVASFVGAQPRDLVFIRNATAGANAIFRSLEVAWSAGDEILVTSHGYNAVRNAAEVSAQRAGAKLVVADMPLRDGQLNLAGPDELVRAVLAQVTPRTRLVVLDHVSSPTAVVFPVAQLVAALEPDVPVLVDGAHAPGMLDLDLDAIGAAYTIANLHKWVCGAKGVGYLHARHDRQAGLSAAIVSHAHNGGWPASSSDFHAHFDWTGTDDPSPWLSVPVAIDTVGAMHPDGWEGVRRANHELAVAARERLLELLQIAPPVPETMLGSMAAVPLPASVASPDSILDPLMTTLRRKYAIEVPVFVWPAAPQRTLRVSAHRYNVMADYERLVDALRIELRL